MRQNLCQSATNCSSHPEMAHILWSPRRIGKAPGICFASATAACKCLGRMRRTQSSECLHAWTRRSALGPRTGFAQNSSHIHGFHPGNGKWITLNILETFNFMGYFNSMLNPMCESTRSSASTSVGNGLKSGLSFGSPVSCWTPFSATISFAL